MLLCTDAEAASADLASGRLACPSCRAGRLWAWGYGRERVKEPPMSAAGTTNGEGHRRPVSTVQHLFAGERLSKVLGALGSRAMDRLAVWPPDDLLTTAEADVTDLAGCPRPAR